MDDLTTIQDELENTRDVQQDWDYNNFLIDDNRNIFKADETEIAENIGTGILRQGGNY